MQGRLARAGCHGSGSGRGRTMEDVVYARPRRLRERRRRQSHPPVTPVALCERPLPAWAYVERCRFVSLWFPSEGADVAKGTFSQILSGLQVRSIWPSYYDINSCIYVREFELFFAQVYFLTAMSPCNECSKSFPRMSDPTCAMCKKLEGLSVLEASNEQVSFHSQER